ncbi:alpha/beta-hydrolase [Clavulina sp. PMI_390]|nr:alpha/beta-hydrolase [Clavulina sp. PMI_390]
MASSRKDALELPTVPSQPSSTRRGLNPRRIAIIALGALIGYCSLARAGLSDIGLPFAYKRSLAVLSFVVPRPLPVLDVYSHVVKNDICRRSCTNATSYSGHIDISEDTDQSPRRSFFWYFQAQEDYENAPVILSFGGGPGTSGLFNALSGQAPCRIAANGTILVNPHAWTTKYNLVVLDHPIGAGFSYGRQVDNSEDAAKDVYDFLQKFLTLFPYLAGNRLVLSGGSYGGIYVPTIATEIRRQNQALIAGHGPPGAQLLHLDTLLVSNPMTDIVSYYEWLLYHRCELHDVYNATTCSSLYKALPDCLSLLDLSTTSIPSLENKIAAFKACSRFREEDTHGTVIVDIRRKCQDSEDPIDCSIPTRRGFMDFFTSNETKLALGVPLSLDWSLGRMSVAEAFAASGDIVRRRHTLYEPLLADGMRLLHYIGAQDANCAWPGTLAFLKLIRSPFQAEFIAARDRPWGGYNATIRTAGPGAGSVTYALLSEAGHYVIDNQTKLVREIIGRFIDNIPYM